MWQRQSSLKASNETTVGQEKKSFCRKTHQLIAEKCQLVIKKFYNLAHIARRVGIHETSYNNLKISFLNNKQQKSSGSYRNVSKLTSKDAFWFHPVSLWCFKFSFFEKIFFEFFDFFGWNASMEIWMFWQKYKRIDGYLNFHGMFL